MQSQCSEWKQMTFEAVFKTLFLEWNYLCFTFWGTYNLYVLIKYIIKFTYLKKVVTNGRRGTFSVLAFTTIFLQVNLIKKGKTSKKIFTVKPFLGSHPLLGSHCNVPETVALITVKLTCIKHSPLISCRLLHVPFLRFQQIIFYCLHLY